MHQNDCLRTYKQYFASRSLTQKILCVNSFFVNFENIDAWEDF